MKNPFKKKVQEVETTIPKEYLTFFWGVIKKKEGYKTYSANFMPFDIREVKDLKEEDKWDRLKDLAVDYLRKEGELPSFAKEQDYERDGACGYWGYRGLVAIANKLNPKPVAPKEIKIFNNAFDKIVLPDGYKERIIETIEQLKSSKKIFKDWGLDEKITKGKGINILLSGASGTGKTYCGEIIAEYLGIKPKIVSTAQLESKWFGESEQNINKVFSQLTGLNQVLILDEVDSFLTSRSKVSQSHESKLVNQFLIELERHNGICVMTTNRPIHLDKALERRIDLNLDFPMPDQDARRKIWEYMIPKKMPTKNIDYDKLASHILHGGQIKNCVLSVARKASYRNLNTIDQTLFSEAISEELAESSELSKKDYS